MQVMTKSDALRLRDVRDALRLLGECRDLGNEPALWFPHLLRGIGLMIGALIVGGGEGRWPRGEPIRAVSAYDATDDETAHRYFLAYQRAGGQAGDPMYRAMATMPGRIDGRTLTRMRSQMVSDADWFRSSSYQEFRRPARLEHEMTSILTTSVEDVVVISMIRAAHETDYSERERRLVYFLHRELGQLLGGALVTDTEPTPDGLPPRLRQTLACLVEGDGEKQIAARLGLSQATVHQYVTMLYRRFQVRSRAQLLAHVMRRLPHERWRGLVPLAR